MRGRSVNARRDGRYGRRYRCLASVLAVLTGLLPMSDRAYGAIVDDVRADAEWIMSARLADGAIANYVDKRAIWPYLSNFAAMGLARATEITRDKRYVSAAWTWAGWYQSHMDAQGFVTDYAVENGKAVSTGFMDSTDAYAGTFLIALRDIYRADRDLRRLRTFAGGIRAAVGAIEATQTADGLTWAKPTWRVKYLMDQAEVYAGLRAGAEVASALGDTALVSRALRDADRVHSGVAALWNTSVAAYDWAVHTDGARVPTAWRYLYSDALQQTWAVAFGLVPTARATSLMSRFVAEQPAWAMPSAAALYSGNAEMTVGYWPVTAMALHRVGSTAGRMGSASIRRTAIEQRRAWPFTTATAGQLILSQTITLSGARTLDATTATSRTSSATSRSAGATAVSVTSGSGSPPTSRRSTQPTASPQPTPAPTPTPTSSPYVRIGDEMGPVGAEVWVGPEGAGANATAAPVSGTPAPDR